MFSDCTWLHAPPAITPRSPSTVCSRNLTMAASSVRIAIVGDVHDDWSLEEDTQALQLLKPIDFGLPYLSSSLVKKRKTQNVVVACRIWYCSQAGALFLPFGAVYMWGMTADYQSMKPSSFKIKPLHSFRFKPAGDFGNENVDLVQSASNLDFPKAIILGNHDAWNTQKFSAREKDAVQLQLDALGDEHVGYRLMNFPNLNLSIVGGRPFSCGGQQVYRKKLLSARYGVHDMDESAKRIYDVALKTPIGHSVIFLAHNGPTGLGSNVDDICGKDWVPEAGDHGDPDLARAISQLTETSNLLIKLVVFGHMHKELARGNGHRKMIVVGDDNTIYLNGAIVPRVKTISKAEEASSISGSSKSEMTSDMTSASEGGTLRAFTVADLADGSIVKITETWVSVIGEKVKVVDEVILFNKTDRISSI